MPNEELPNVELSITHEKPFSEMKAIGKKVILALDEQKKTVSVPAKPSVEEENTKQSIEESAKGNPAFKDAVNASGDMLEIGGNISETDGVVSGNPDSNLVNSEDTTNSFETSQASSEEIAERMAKEAASRALKNLDIDFSKKI